MQLQLFFIHIWYPADKQKQVPAETNKLEEK